MMSSELTETEVFGLLPKKQTPSSSSSSSSPPSSYSHASTIFASSSLIKLGVGGFCYLFKSELHHII